jgi:hypothetical protein
VTDADGTPRVVLAPATVPAATADSVPQVTDRIDEVEQSPRLIVGRPPTQAAPVSIVDTPVTVERPEDTVDTDGVSTVDSSELSTLESLDAVTDLIDEVATAVHNGSTDDDIRRLMALIVRSDELVVAQLTALTEAVQSIGEMQQWTVNSVGAGLNQLQRIVGSGNPMKMMGELRKMATEMNNGGG